MVLSYHPPPPNPTTDFPYTDSSAEPSIIAAGAGPPSIFIRRGWSRHTPGIIRLLSPGLGPGVVARVLGPAQGVRKGEVAWQSRGNDTEITTHVPFSLKLGKMWNI